MENLAFTLAILKNVRTFWCNNLFYKIAMCFFMSIRHIF